MAANDTLNIYADNSGYNACLDDAQVTGETDRIVAALGMPVDYGHIYVMYLPKHVESCSKAGSTGRTGTVQINHQPSALYCAYHSQDRATPSTRTCLPHLHSQVGFTCGSDASFPDVQSPNGDHRRHRDQPEQS